MGEPERKLDLVGAESSEGTAHSPRCPVTDLTIPECSCRRCAEAQIKTHAPWLLERRLPAPRRHGPGRAA